jgi:hypothetical protein
MKQIDRQALREWDELREAILSSTTVDFNESAADKLKRIARLEAHDEEWFKYYFPNYASAEPAPFHKKATKRVMSNPEFYEARPWSRELAKSTRTMMEVLKLTLTGKKRNVILTSNSYDNAERLITPYKINLESNQRIINDYGTQEQLGHWEAGEFLTRKGVAFRAIGAGQSPRGTRNEAIRPDVILVDDFDTDEDCRNPELVKKKWDWLEQALIPTRSISVPLLIIFCGNIIAKDCCMLRAIQKADYYEIVNIRDINSLSTWPTKNTEAHIDRVLSIISWASAQKEYFNNPISEGTVFKEMTWGKVPPLKSFRFLVAYGDPAPSNKEAKGKTGACYKSLFLLGALNGKIYVITGFLQHVKNAEYVQWYYDIDNYVKGKTQVYNYIENNSLQDPFFEQVFKPLFHEAYKANGKWIGINPDARKKPEKFARIEGNLEPLNRVGNLILNEEEKTNPHMQRLEEQFKSIDPTLSALCDGPDAVEGGWFIINQKANSMQPTDTIKATTLRNKNKHRY